MGGTGLDQRIGKNMNEETEQKAKQIILDVSTRHGVSFEQVIGPQRFKKLIPPRVEIAVLLRAMDISLEKIGKLMGDRDHTSIMFYLRKAEKMKGENNGK